MHLISVFETSLKALILVFGVSYYNFVLTYHFLFSTACSIFQLHRSKDRQAFVLSLGLLSLQKWTRICVCLVD